jgi:hypothetical protein
MYYIKYYNIWGDIENILHFYSFVSFYFMLKLLSENLDMFKVLYIKKDSKN